jgi:hypothetical protein
MRYVPSNGAAKSLGIAREDLKTLVDQGIIHPVLDANGRRAFLRDEVSQIKSRRAPTLSEEAAQVGVQIQQEIEAAVTGLQKFVRRVSALSFFVGLLLALSTLFTAFLFSVRPEQTSDFFGYYYRFNKVDNPNVLAAAVGPDDVSVKTSVLADVIKPVAGASLIVVKATDSQKHEQIVTNPVLGNEIPGPQGPKGEDGGDGVDGVTLADVMAEPGDLMVRDVDNETVRLSVGKNNQVLTIMKGEPKWKDLSALTINTGDGLAGGGMVSLGEFTSIDIDLDVNSGLEFLDSKVTLLQSCEDGQFLKWTDAGGWACAGPEVTHAVFYNTSENSINVTSSETTLATISVTPATSTADIYVTGHAEVFSDSATDQPFTLVIETSNNCSGSVVGNATVTYTITSTPSAYLLRGVLVVSGVDVNSGATLKSYSLCASTSAGNTDVQNWRLEALVLE